MADDQEPQAKQEKQSRSRVLPIVIGVLLVVVTIGGTAWFFLRRAAAQSPQKENGPLAGQQQKVKSVLHLETFTVNLADPDQNAFLRAGIDLGVREELGEAKGAEKGSALTPRIRDTVLLVLTTWQSSALLAQDGKTKLKQELLQALQKGVPELGVTEVYFTEFLVQR